MNHKPPETKTHLDKYQKAVRGMSYEESQSFAQIFIGGLSFYVPPHIWNRCLESAKRRIEEMRLTPTPTPPSASADAADTE